MSRGADSTQQQKGNFLMDLAAERSNLLAHDAQWSSLCKAGQDVEGMLAYWSEDAVVYPPGMPAVIGKSAIREYVNASLAIPGFAIEWSPQAVALSDDASMGYTTGTNAMTVNGDDGVAVVHRGRYVAIWHRLSDAAWQCVEDVLIPMA
jgi:ketosteroid isomerase-like protein